MTNLDTMGKFNSIKYFIHPKYEVSNQDVMSNDDYVVLVLSFVVADMLVVTK